MQATLEKKSTISQVTKRDKEYALLMQTDGSTDGNIKNDDNINRINNLIYNGNVKVQDEKLIRTHDLKDVLPKYMIPEHSSIVSYFNLKQQEKNIWTLGGERLFDFKPSEKELDMADKILEYNKNLLQKIQNNNLVVFDEISSFINYLHNTSSFMSRM